jgi:hypothetical protein
LPGGRELALQQVPEGAQAARVVAVTQLLSGRREPRALRSVSAADGSLGRGEQVSALVLQREQQG